MRQKSRVELRWEINLGREVWQGNTVKEQASILCSTWVIEMRTESL